MSAKIARLLEIWELQSMPACDEGMMLADLYVGRCLEACSIHDEAEAIPKRNHIIRAHKEFVAHRASGGKCNEVDIIP